MTRLMKVSRMLQNAVVTHKPLIALQKTKEIQEGNTLQS